MSSRRAVDENALLVCDRNAAFAVSATGLMMSCGNDSDEWVRWTRVSERGCFSPRCRHKRRILKQGKAGRTLSRFRPNNTGNDGMKWPRDERDAQGVGVSWTKPAIAVPSHPHFQPPCCRTPRPAVVSSKSQARSGLVVRRIPRGEHDSRIKSRRL